MGSQCSVQQDDANLVAITLRTVPMRDHGRNVQTGQCFYRDGTCDPGPGGEGVCAPGGTCTLNPLDDRRMFMPEGQSR